MTERAAILIAPGLAGTFLLGYYGGAKGRPCS